MKILFTGRYDPDYNRTAILRKGIATHGHDVIEFPFKKWNKNVKIRLKDLSSKVDYIFLPSFTHGDVKRVKTNTDKTLIFDPLISKYLTKVFDYKQVHRYSPRAYKNYLKDKVALKNSDIIITDTDNHARYYSSKFKIPLHKFHTVPVGVDTDDFYPSPQKNNNLFQVGFYGGFIPLQGVKKIIEAAKLLSNENIHFTLIGDGYEYNSCVKLVDELKVNNLQLVGYKPYKDLPALINSFDLCLGIFGDSRKAQLVIPNKIFHYAACGKPILTMKSEAIKEIFKEDDHIYFCENNSQDIASRIKWIRGNYAKTVETGKNAGELIRNNFNFEKIGQMFLNILDDYNKP